MLTGAHTEPVYRYATVQTSPSSATMKRNAGR